MKLRAIAAAAFAMCVSSAVGATQSYVDGYYVPSADLELSDNTGSAEFDDGDGFGVKGMVHFTPEMFFTAEYQANSYDGINGFNVDGELNNLRAGVGFHPAASPFYAVAEFINLELEISGAGGSASDDESGFGLHGGARGEFGGGFSGQAQVGYLDVGDAGDGFEFLVGVAFQIVPAFGVFADYRSTSLEEDVETDAADIRVGGRFTWGPQ